LERNCENLKKKTRGEIQRGDPGENGPKKTKENIRADSSNWSEKALRREG